MKSDDHSTPIPHFIAKINIEKHLNEAAKKMKGQIQWTIFRSVALMESLTNKLFLAKVSATLWPLNEDDRRLQLVSTQDIGFLVAEAFKAQNKHAGTAVSLATNDISPNEAEAIFKRVI